jgi:hypothetical protein
MWAKRNAPAQYQPSRCYYPIDVVSDMPPRTTLRPALSESLQNDLAKITPSTDGRVEYFPCSVSLNDGQVLDRVYLVEQYQYIRAWGIYPEPSRTLSVDDIVHAIDSPSRLPPKFADELYAAGESGMGYSIFLIVFADGSSRAYSTGGAVDFIEYPEGKNKENVLRVSPHVGRDSKPFPAPNYYWALYSNEETLRAFNLGLTDPIAIKSYSFAERVKMWLRRKLGVRNSSPQI